MNDENNENNRKNENKIDEDETPNKIIENLEEIEKELESNKNKVKENMGKDNSCLKIKNSPNNNNKFGIYSNDKLLKFQEEFYSKLQIIDDFSDWYEVSNNTWLDEKSREEAKKKDEENNKFEINEDE